MAKIGIAGASGYTGLELLRLLINHPEAEIGFLTSETYSGESISKVFLLSADLLTQNYHPSNLYPAIFVTLCFLLFLIQPLWKRSLTFLRDTPKS